MFANQQTVAGRYYGPTGQSRARSATLSAGETAGSLQLHVEGEAGARVVTLNELSASERFSHATRSVRFADGAVLEVDAGAQLSRVLAAAGRYDALVTRWQRSWRIVVMSLVLSITAAIAGYIWLLPVVADRLAVRVPASWVAALDEVVIGQLQRQDSLQPTALGADGQQHLRSRFEAAVASQSSSPDMPKVNVHFFRLGAMPNAFALPGGSIVFLDGLVKMAPNDDALVGVFAHEYGHVQHRHGLRTLLRTAALSAIAAWYFGDFTSLANAAVIVSQLSHSRAFEAQADDVALELMKANKLDTKSLAELFRRMRDRRGEPDSDSVDDGKSKGEKSAKATGDSAAKIPARRNAQFSVPEFLSSHPDVELRIERFEKASKNP